MEASKSLSCENNNISLFSALPESSNRHYHFKLADDVCDQYNRFVNLMRKEEESSEEKFLWLDDTDERKYDGQRDTGQVC